MNKIYCKISDDLKLDYIVEVISINYGVGFIVSESKEALKAWFIGHTKPQSIAEAIAYSEQLEKQIMIVSKDQLKGLKQWLTIPGAKSYHKDLGLYVVETGLMEELA